MDMNGGIQMYLAMLLIGGFMFLSFPFLVFAKIKKTKQENIEEAKKKLNLFLICMIPVPIIAFIFLWFGFKAFM